MKPIRIADQPKVGLLRTIRITVDGIRYRLFRAAVTVAVIAMAVAFLMNIMSESLVKRSVARDTPRRLAEMRLVYDWAARLTKVETLGQTITELAVMEPGGPLAVEAAAMGRLKPNEMAALLDDARAVRHTLGFFEELGYARRRSLVHNDTGIAILDRLGREDGWERFTTALDSMKSIRKPDLPALKEFVRDRWPKVLDGARRICEGRVEAIAKVTAARGERSILDALAEAGSAFGGGRPGGGVRVRRHGRCARGGRPGSPHPPDAPHREEHPPRSHAPDRRPVPQRPAGRRDGRDAVGPRRRPTRRRAIPRSHAESREGQDRRVGFDGRAARDPRQAEE
ncbi:MAG: hypothetical protein ABIF82_10030 [Planctomycetota bacterium]